MTPRFPGAVINSEIMGQTVSVSIFLGADNSTTMICSDNVNVGGVYICRITPKYRTRRVCLYDDILVILCIPMRFLADIREPRF